MSIKSTRNMIDRMISHAARPINEAWDEEILATGKTAYIPSARLARIAEMNKEIAELRKELGDDFTPDLEDLIRHEFMHSIEDRDDTIKVQGTYGRQMDPDYEDDDEDGEYYRRAGRKR